MSFHTRGAFVDRHSEFVVRPRFCQFREGAKTHPLGGRQVCSGHHEKLPLLRIAMVRTLIEDGMVSEYVDMRISTRFIKPVRTFISALSRADVEGTDARSIAASSPGLKRGGLTDL